MGIEVFAVELIAKFLGVVLIMLGIKAQGVLAGAIVSLLFCAGVGLLLFSVFAKANQGVSTAKESAGKRDYFPLVLVLLSLCYFAYRAVVYFAI